MMKSLLNFLKSKSPTPPIIDNWNGLGDMNAPIFRYLPPVGKKENLGDG